MTDELQPLFISQREQLFLLMALTQIASDSLKSGNVNDAVVYISLADRANHASPHWKPYHIEQFLSFRNRETNDGGSSVCG